ncbi:MAG TPA: hypothetical protein VI603_03520 [Saprospiraceae bacterium]|nr:hypothetical protein [Saprospiraceae bacterium]
MSKTKSASRTGYKFQYAAKFICTANIPGTSQTSDAVVPGSYQTSVNIHNPQNVKVKLRKKIASPIGISNYFEFVLEPDGVAGVTCAQIRDFGLHLIHGFEGFLVIESTHSVDVVAVYSAAGKEQVSSIDVEGIKERKLLR